MSSPRSVPRSRLIVFALIAAGGCAADLWTKHVMFAWPKLNQGDGAIHWVLPGLAGFQTSLNEGALFGMGQGGQFWFAGISILAAIAIPAWLFGRGHARDWWMTIVFAGILGGVLGNLYDRLGLHGLAWGVDFQAREPHEVGDSVYAVRDWILLQASETLRWPNFNIADSLLVIGALLLLLRAWREPASPKTENASSTSQVTTNGSS